MNLDPFFIILELLPDFQNTSDIYNLYATICHHCACPFLLPTHSKCKISNGKPSMYRPLQLKNQVYTVRTCFSIHWKTPCMHITVLFQKSCFSPSSRTGFAHLCMLLGRMCCVYNTLSFLWSVPRAIKVQTKLILLFLELSKFPGQIS